MNNHCAAGRLALAKLQKCRRNLPVRRITVIERRQLPRTKVIQPAKVLAEVGAHNCLVENLNTIGACISFDAAVLAGLPFKFDLTFDNWHTFWHCHMIWQDGDDGRMGVRWKSG
jgi:hypothetical protein